MKLSLSLRNEREDFDPKINVGVFLNLIPEDQSHEQATRAKAGVLRVHSHDIKSVLAQFRPHVSLGLPYPWQNFAVTEPFEFMITRITPAHITFDVMLGGSIAGELTLRNEEFVPLLQHCQYSAYTAPVALRDDVIRYTGV